MYIHNMFVVHIHTCSLKNGYTYTCMYVYVVHMYIHVRRGQAFHEVQLKYGTCMCNFSIVDTTGPRKCVLIREVSLFQRLICTQKYAIGTSETILSREVSLFESCPLRDVPLYIVRNTKHFNTFVRITAFILLLLFFVCSVCGSWRWS